jgi:RNA polymerase sigma-70 factor (ECF subfamily)
MDTTSPSLLVRLQRPGETNAWTRFVQLYTPLLLVWLRSWGLQEQDAADLAQEVFLVLLKKLPEFRYDPQQRFRQWLKTIALNKFRDFRRRRTPLATANGLTDVASPEDEYDFVESEYRQYLVGRALEFMQVEFPPKLWQACWRHVVEGRSAAQVAAELGISPATVYVAKARVLHRLRQELAGLLD